MSRSPFWGNTLYRVLGAVTLLVTLWVCTELMGYPLPPPMPATTHGAGFRVERGEQHVIHLQGSPYALGFHNSRLLAPLMKSQEETLLDLLFSFAGGPGAAIGIRHLSLMYLTGLDAYLLPRERHEILGLAHGAADPFPDLGPRYARIASYHAIHELSQRFATDNPMACSLLLVGKERGVDNHAFLARNFDFEGGDIFDRDKVVLAVRPDDGYGFVSISWAGMAGVVSGMNEHGLAIVINAGASEDYNRVGAPTTLLVRRALEQARTIDEAVDVLTAAPRFVTDIIGLADREGSVAVLELTPNHHALRRGEILAATNQLESEALGNDPVSKAREQETTTVFRRERLGQLIKQELRLDPIGVDRLLAVLRDRRGAQRQELPLGHRHAIDALIASHSVIFDATAGKVWVSEGPRTLGPYHGYDVAALLRADSPEEMQEAWLPDLPASPLLALYPMVARGRELLREAEAALDANLPQLADEILHKTTAIGDHPRTLEAKGRLALQRGDNAFARELLTEALNSPPEYAHRAVEIRQQLERVPGPADK